MTSSRPRIRRLLLALAALPLLLVAAGIALGIAVLHGFERERVRDGIEAELASWLDVPVAIGALGGPLHRAPVVRELRIGSEDAPLLVVTEVSIEVGRLALDPPALELAEVRVEGVRVRWPELAELLSAEETRPVGESEATEEPGLPFAVRIARGALGIDRIDVAWGERTAEVAGALGFEAWAWPAGAPASFPFPEVADAQLSVAAPGLSPAEAIAGELVAGLADGIVTLQPSRLLAGSGTAEVSGHTRLGPWLAGEVDGDARLDARVHGLDLATLLGDPDLASDLAGEIAIRPRGSDGIAVLADLAGETATVGAVDAVHADARIGSEAWRLDVLRIRSPGLTLEGEGAGAGGRIDIAKLAVAGDAALLDPWLPEGSALAGSLRAKLDAARSGGVLRTRVELASDALVVGDFPPIALDLLAHARDLDELEVERARIFGDGRALEVVAGATVARSGGGVLLSGVELRTAEGTLRLAGGVGPERFRELVLEARDFDVVLFGVLVPELDLAGKLEGSVLLDGPFTRPDLRGELAWIEGSLLGEPFEDLRLALAPDGDQLRGSGVARTGAEAIELTAGLPRDVSRWAPECLVTDPLLEARLQTEQLDLAALDAFLPDVPNLRELRGSATGTIDVRGTPAGLDIAADVAIAETSAFLVPIGRRLGPARARILFDEGVLRVEGGVVEGTQGEVRLDGSLPFDPADARAAGAGLAVRIEVDGYALAIPPVVPAGFLDGSLALTGSLEAPTVRGELAVSGLEVRIPRSTGRLGSDFRVSRGPSTRFEEPSSDGPELAEADMDIRILLSEPAHVAGQGLDLQIEGDLRYRSEPGRVPEWFGGGRVVRGSAGAFGRTFVVQRGEAALAGEAELDPLLDVRANYPVADVVLIAIIEGRASSPTIRLDSEPPLSEDDRLSYLLFGRPLDADSGTGDAALSAMAAQLAGGVALAELNRRLGGRLPIDQFTVRSGGDGTEFGIGANLGDRTTVRGTTQMGGETETRLEFEYRFAPGWSVRGTGSDRGHAGADLIWTKSY